MKTDEQLRKAIMRRVYVLYGVRQIMRPRVRAVALVAIAALIASSVSVPHIIVNALSSSNVFAYALSAIAGTRLFIQLGILLAFLIMVLPVVGVLSPRLRAEA